MTQEESTPLGLSAHTPSAFAVLAWGAVAVLVSVTGLGGMAGGVLAASFALLGLGVALVVALGGTVTGALRLSLMLGFGPAACTAIGLLLIGLGQYTPSAVIGIELALALVILGARGVRS